MDRLTMSRGICQMVSTDYCHKHQDCYTCGHGRQVFKRLAAYEDTGLEPEEIEDLKQMWDMYGGEEGITAMLMTPPNPPLTLAELREMDGEPVYVRSALGEQPMWYIVDVEDDELKNPWDRICLEDWDEGYPYKAYRRKPEEGKT